MAYLSLFLASFIAATLLPAASELTLSALAIAGYNAHLLWLSATLGNTLGAIVNWWLGRFMLHYQCRVWFPIDTTQLPRYQHWFQRYGVYTLFFAWLPLVGDYLTFLAGVMRVPFLWFVFWVGLGKGTRYFVVLYWLDVV